MRNSLLWTVSILLSGLAHYGLIAAAAHIPLPSSQQDQVAEVVLGAFEPLSLDTSNASSALDSASVGAAEISEVKPETSTALPSSEVTATEPVTPASEQVAPSASTEVAEAKTESNPVAQTADSPSLPASSANVSPATTTPETEVAESKTGSNPVSQTVDNPNLPASGADAAVATATPETEVAESKTGSNLVSQTVDSPSLPASSSSVSPATDAPETEVAENKAESNPVAQTADNPSLPASGADVAVGTAASGLAEVPEPAADIPPALHSEPAAPGGSLEVLDAGTQLSSLGPRSQADNTLVTQPDAAPASPGASEPAAELTEETPSAPLLSGIALPLSSGAVSNAVQSPTLSLPAGSPALPSSALSNTATEIAAEPAPSIQEETLQETQLASAATSTTQTMSQAEKVKSFLANYPAGNCVMAVAADGGSAQPNISGLGGDGAPIAEFAAAFRKSVGVDPALSLEKIRDAQCPAVDFIRAMGGPSPDMKLILDRNNIADTHTLTGNIQGFRRGHLSLLFVDDEGAVVDISSELYPHNGRIIFAIGVKALGQGLGRNQLALAIASSQPIDFNVTRKPGEALRIFEEIQQAARHAKGTVAIAYAAFRIE